MKSKVIKVNRENLFEISKFYWVWVDYIKRENFNEITLQKDGALEFDGNSFYYKFSVFDYEQEKYIKKKMKVEDIYLKFVIPNETKKEEEKIKFNNIIENLFTSVEKYIIKDKEFKVDKISIKEIKALNFENFELTIFSDEIYKIKFTPKYEFNKDEINKFKNIILNENFKKILKDIL